MSLLVSISSSKNASQKHLKSLLYIIYPQCLRHSKWSLHGYYYKIYGNCRKCKPQRNILIRRSVSPNNLHFLLILNYIISVPPDILFSYVSTKYMSQIIYFIVYFLKIKLKIHCGHYFWNYIRMSFVLFTGCVLFHNSFDQLPFGYLIAFSSLLL